MFKSAPCGSLRDHLQKHDSSTGHLKLSKSSLIHLHELDPQIVHRDVKTGIILVSYRRNHKKEKVLKTFRSTMQNLPHELYNIPLSGHTPAYDM